MQAIASLAPEVEEHQLEVRGKGWNRIKEVAGKVWDKTKHILKDAGRKIAGTLLAEIKGGKAAPKAAKRSESDFKLQE